MKTAYRSILAAMALAAFLPQASHSQTNILDPFTTSVNWGPAEASPGKTIFVADGRMNFISTTNDAGYAAIRRIGPILPTTQDWSLKIDVHIDPFPPTSPGQYADVFLGFGKTGDELNTHVLFEFDRADGAYDILDDVRINGAAVLSLFNVGHFGSADAALRLEYNASNRTITYLFDADGAANGYHWAAQGTANIASGTYNLNLGPADTFTILLAGSTVDQLVNAGQAYLDNLEITIAPPADRHTQIRSDFGVRSNHFGFTIEGAANIPIVVEASTNLFTIPWTPLQTCTLTNGAIYFRDPQWTNHPGRFYRVRSP